jgi:hypothetical protein
MNEKVRKIALLLAIVVVLVIFVDLIFNFSGLMKENFTVSSSYNSQSEDGLPNEKNDDELNHTNIKCVVAKTEGKLVKVSFVPNDPNNKTVVLESPVSKNANISVNSDGTLSEKLKASTEASQQFKLTKIENSADYNDLLKESNNGTNTASTVTTYPFYILKSVKFGEHNWCLAYEPGKLYLSPIGNYNNQKWDVSNIEVKSTSVLTHTVDNTGIGSFNKNGDTIDGEIDDPNKIKINLNLTDELKRQLLGVEPSGGSGSGSGSSSNSDFYSQKCSSTIPKNALSSLCRGCDPERL